MDMENRSAAHGSEDKITRLSEVVEESLSLSLYLPKCFLETCRASLI